MSNTVLRLVSEHGHLYVDADNASTALRLSCERRRRDIARVILAHFSDVIRVEVLKLQPASLVAKILNVDANACAATLASCDENATIIEVFPSA